MKKILLALLFFSAFPLAALADLPKVPFDNIEGEFHQTKTFADTELALRSRGNFRAKKNVELFWHTLKPIETGFLLTPDGAFQIRKNKKTPLPESAHPTLKTLYLIFEAAFSGDEKTLARIFEISRERDAEVWTLVPVEKTLSAFVKKIELRAAAGELKEVHLLDASGDATRIEFLNVREAR